MFVEINKCSSHGWYNKLIGKVFDVRQHTQRIGVWLIKDESIMVRYGNRWLYKDDCVQASIMDKVKIRSIRCL